MTNSRNVTFRIPKYFCSELKSYKISTTESSIDVSITVVNRLALKVKLVKKKIWKTIVLKWLVGASLPPVDVQNSYYPRDENQKNFHHQCHFVRGTFISWNREGEIFRLEMVAVFVNIGMFFRFILNSGFSVFLLSSTKLLWCFLNSLGPTFHQFSSHLSTHSF